ncbi:tRNA lysidine(34) synthetase TilS [Pontimicrobium sp. MEBiC01747]
MIKTFKNHIENQLPFLKEKKLLIAISGGLDSIVLTHLCYKLGLNISLAHCNFNLRGKESDGDEAFVLELAEQLNLEIFTQSFDTSRYANNNKLSIQIAARELRYTWFKELSKQLQFDYILTAHHADDALETFLINLTRATGLDGLTGIPELNNTIVRPLLPYSRGTIEHFARTNHYTWREDSSNASTKYLRNKLRHDVIPILKEINPQLLNGFQSTLQHLQDAADIVENSVNDVLKKATVKETKTTITYNISVFKALKNPKAYIYHIFKAYGFTAYEDVYNLLEAQSGKQVFSKTHRLIKNRENLILTVIANEADNSILISKENKVIKTPLGTIIFKEVNEVSKTQKNELFVDADTLQFPLEIRRWKDGELFYPMGMQGKKKLSKFFKDEKFSLLDKEKCLLLYSNNEVVWIINYRGDNRYKITEKTKRIFKITLQD